MIANRYQIESILGSGGMGTVYKGYDTLIGQTVAIKELRPELSQPDFIERFKREGEALRELDHPNIVKLLDTVIDDKSYYLILEYVSGGDLNDLIRLGQISIERIIQLAIDLADALTRAHKLQIIHRDLKPANVLVTHDGTLRLTDFGIAHVSRKERVTEAASILGTVDYLSPEMLNGEVIDYRVDIWAFGVILFEMLASQHPFRDESITGTITKILTETPPDLESLRPDAPISLIDLVYTMLERDRKSRIASARHVGAELEDIWHDRQKPSNPHNRFVTPVSERLAHPKHNLPSQATPFVGREREIEELTQLLSNPQIRLVTVLAPGGMGKTRLSLEVAKRQIGTFSNGIFFVELTALTDSATIPSAIADAISYQLQVDGREPKKQILDYLANKHMLLVIDNWEHLIDGAVIVSEIIQAAVDVKIVVTSRERLNLQEETVFRVEGLDFPDQDTPPDEVEHSAVKLFVQSAKRVQPAFKLKANDVKHIIRICQLVEGMPLGILLAAAWLDTLSLHEIGDEIDKSLNFLETEARNVPKRHRSIRAVFDYSWNLITEAERDVLMKLSVFRGGFTREAAQQVAGATLRQLATLVNKSLISREADTGRYRIHELLRQYSEAQFHAHPDDATQVDDLHCEFYTRFVHAHVAMHGGNQIQATAELEGDLENIRAAWRWAIEHGKVEAIQRSVHTLHNLYQFRSRYLEGAEAFAKALKSLDLLESTDQQQYTLAIVLVGLGWFYLRLGQIDDAMSVLERSQAIFEALKVPPPALGAADPLAALSIVTVVLGDYTKAVQIGEQAYQACQARGDRGNLISCSLALASAYMAQGDYQTAQQVAQRGCGFAQELGHDWLNAYCLNLLGSATQALGDYAEAQEHYRISYMLREKFNDPEGMAVALNHLGNLAWVQENYAEAKLHYQHSLALYQNIGDKGGLAGALLGLGLADCKLEDDQSARKHFYAALHTALDAHLMPLVIITIVSIVEVFPESWSRELAIELLILTLDSPGGDYETRDKAQKLLTSYQVIPERLAEIRGSADFDKATSTLLMELRKPVEKPAPFPASQQDNWQLVDPLTERELAIIHFIADGLSNHEIASKLFISIGTVKWYCSQIYAKFGVKSRTQAILYAKQLNLLP
jgi:serine/threonine protein kinase/DNA-binding CsgD family transcriptional regulator/tetratricopeptide (TPR) repeat protein